MSLDALPVSFFERPIAEVAVELIGCRIVSEIGGEPTSGRIVETEAYGMEEDAFYGRHVRPSPTGEITTSPTGEVLLGKSGVAFVYSVFFGNWLLNVVAGPRGYLGCVLLRSVEPTAGFDTMRRRRNTKDDRHRLASGPGRLTRAFGVDGSLNGQALHKSPLALCLPKFGPPPMIQTTPRIGVKTARQLPWRFIDASSRSVSHPPSRIAERRGSP